MKLRTTTIARRLAPLLLVALAAMVLLRLAACSDAAPDPVDATDAGTDAADASNASPIIDPNPGNPH